MSSRGGFGWVGVGGGRLDIADLAVIAADIREEYQENCHKIFPNYFASLLDVVFGSLKQGVA